MLRRNHNADTTMAVTVTVHETNMGATTNVASDWLSNSQIVIVALHACANAHNSEICRKKRRTCAFVRTSSGSGQKSVASFAASGRFNGTDTKNAVATSAVPSDG